MAKLIQYTMVSVEETPQGPKTRYGGDGPMNGMPFKLDETGIRWPRDTREDRPVNAAEVARAAQWIRLWMKEAYSPCMMTRPTRESSYHWKHACERWGQALEQLGYCPRADTYVSNGAFITAVLRAGFTICTSGEMAPNCRVIADVSAWRAWETQHAYGTGL